MRQSSFLEVDLSLLSENVQKIQSLAPRAKLLPMVKADAYGNGLVPISQHLVGEHGCRTLGVATLGEALKLQLECPDLDAEVMVFSDTEIHDSNLRSHYHNFNITPVLHRIEDVNVFLTAKELRDVPLVLKVNTGMNRLGLTLEELEEVAARLKGRGVQHLMTHFACSYYEKKDGDKTSRQLLEFESARKILSERGVEVRETSLANSGAIEQGIGVEESFVRPGLMMYGPPSVEPSIWSGHQISRLVTKVLKTFTVKKGTPVGYGVNVAPEDGFIVVLPVGYGDGILTFFAGVTLKINGYSGRIFARVNMDMCFVFFDVSLEGKIRTGDVVEIWNHDNRVITDIATQMKTIPYQLMCGISGRIPRIYKVK